MKEGYECGIGIETNDIKVGDVFECYRTEEVARTLDQAAKLRRNHGRTAAS